MPNIRTFDVPQEQLQPSEVGVESVAAAARRGGTFYNQAGAALTSIGQHVASATKDAGDLAINYIQHREISAGAANLAQMEDSYTGAWQKMAANPNVDWNDPTIVQQFRAGMEPNLQKFKDSFITEGGRQWAEGRVDQFREHMFHKTAADQSTMAAAAIAENAEKTVNAATSRVYKDPSSLSDALDGLHNSFNNVVDSSPVLDVGTRASTKASLFKQDEKLVKSAIMGAIRNGGDWRTIADNPKYSKYINAAEIDQFAKAEERQDRTAQLQKREMERYDRQQKVQQGLDTAAKVRSDNIVFNEDGTVTVKPNLYQDLQDIGDQNGTHEVVDHVQAVSKWAAAQQKEKREVVLTNKGVLNDLITRIPDATNPTTEQQIWKAAADKELDPTDLRNVLSLYNIQNKEWLRDPFVQEKLKSIKGILGVDTVADGHDRYSTFLSRMIKEFPTIPEPQRAAALDTNDPNSWVSKIIGSEPGQGLRPTQTQMLQGSWEKRLRMPGAFSTPAGAAPGATAPGAFVAPRTWEWSASRRQYRDPATGLFYDAAGRRVTAPKP